MERPILRQFMITDFVIAFDRVFQENYFFEGESHNFIEIVYCDSDSFEVTRNEQVCKLNAGDLLFHAPMEFHRNHTDADATPRVVQLSFRHTGQMPKFLFDGVFPLSAEEKDTFWRIFRLADRFMTDAGNPLLGQEAAEHLSAFILALCRKTHAQSRLSNATGALAYQKLIRSMHVDLYQNLKLSDFAKKNYMSVSYMKSLFARYAGIGPKTYYNNLRINEAARLLSTGAAVQEVAEKMNFSSPNYLTMMFKKQMGVTPMQYKKRGI